MWARIPIIGWFIGFMLDAFLAIPTYFLWNHVVPKYFNFIPEIYHNLPFWDIVWLVMLIGIVKHVLTGGVFVQSSSSKTKKEKDV